MGGRSRLWPRRKQTEDRLGARDAQSIAAATHRVSVPQKCLWTGMRSLQLRLVCSAKSRVTTYATSGTTSHRLSKPRSADLLCRLKFRPTFNKKGKKPEALCRNVRKYPRMQKHTFRGLIRQMFAKFSRPVCTVRRKAPLKSTKQTLRKLSVQAALQNSGFYSASIWLESLKDEPFLSISQDS